MDEDKEHVCMSLTYYPAFLYLWKYTGQPLQAQLNYATCAKIIWLQIRCMYWSTLRIRVATFGFPPGMLSCALPLRSA